MAQSSPVYDPDADERPGSQHLPDDEEMRQRTGISADQEQAIERDALQDAEQKGFYNPEGEGSDKKPAAPSSLRSAEQAAAGAASALGPAATAAIKIKGLLNNRKKTATGLGAVIGAALISAIIFFAMIPLKIEHVITNLQSRYFAAAEQASQKQLDNMFQQYVINHVLPSYRKCGTTVSKDCRVTNVKGGSNPVSNMYRSWSNAKLENKLATKYGIEFRYNTGSKTWELKAPGAGGQAADVGPNGEKLGQEFQRADRATMRTAYRQALENETKWKRLMYRYKVGRLLEAKYGVTRCLIFCGTRDALAGKIAEQKNAAKIYLVQRVITPRAQVTGVLLECLISNCDATSAKPTNDPATHGEPINSNTDAVVRQNLRELAAVNGIADVDKLLADYAKISEKGFQAYMLEKALAPIFRGATGLAVDAVPIVGWANLAAQIISQANHAGPAIKKMTYVANAASAVQLFSMYRTYADEIHTGKVTATEVGSMVSSLGAGDLAGKDKLGGNASAENTPLYSALMGSAASASQTPVASLTGSLLPAAAAAPQTANPTYLCNDGKPVPAGKLVCSEETVGGGNGVADALHSFLNMPGINVITEIANIWTGITGAIFNLIGAVTAPALSVAGSAMDKLCGNIITRTGTAILTTSGSELYCAGKPVVEKAIPFITKAVIGWLIPNPFGDNMSGGRIFDGIAMGADVAGNDFAHTGLGGQKLSSAQANAIYEQQLAQAKTDFQSRPFTARMFATDTPYSLLSSASMTVPFDTIGATQNNFASLMANPFSVLINTFASFLTPRSFAAPPYTSDPFGVTQYGFTSVPSDPEAYWNQHCSDNPGQAYQNDAEYNANGWNQQAANNIDPDTGMPTNTTANPCLLIKSVTGTGGGLFDKSLLTNVDLNGAGGASGPPPGPAGAGIDTNSLFQSSVSVPCAAGTTDLGTNTGYSGGQPVEIRLCGLPNLPSSSEESNSGTRFYINGANGMAIVNSRVSGAYLAMITAAKATNIDIRANSSFRTMAHQTDICNSNASCSAGSYTLVAKPGTSNHQMGLAIDFNVPFCGSRDAAGKCSDPGNPIWDWLNAKAGEYGIKQYPAEAWHWSPTGN